MNPSIHAMRPPFRTGSLVCLFISLFSGGRTVSAQSMPGDYIPATGAPSSTVTRTQASINILTVPNAQVTVKNLGVKNADSFGLASFEKVKPGLYEVSINLEGYKTLQLKGKDSLRIAPGPAKYYQYVLLPTSGTLVLSMGAQAADDVQVLIDGQKYPADKITIDAANGKVFVEKINLLDKDEKTIVRREREIVIRKPYHDDFSFKREIKPGKCDNDIAVTLKRQVVTLTVEGIAGARVYLNKSDRGRIPTDGRLVIPDLLPGEYSLSAELIGYREIEQKVSLTPGLSESKIALNLESLVETAEANLEFFDDKEKAEFYPARPSNWNLNPRKRLTVTGGGIALLRSATYPDRDFAFYRDFTLTLSVRMLNGNGAAWVARANGKGDYYLFEIKPEKVGGKTQVVFSASRCISGVCSQLNRLDLSTTYPRIATNPSFRIYLTASGNEFWHCIEEGEGLKPIGQVITDPSFERGGVGLYGGNGHEFDIFQFNVVPYNTCNSQCERITRPR